jgi:hypothetical protein
LLWFCIPAAGGIAATGTKPAAGGYCGGVVGAPPAAAVWSAPHFEQKRSPFANWLPQLTQNAMPLTSHIFLQSPFLYQGLASATPQTAFPVF